MLNKKNIGTETKKPTLHAVRSMLRLELVDILKATPNILLCFQPALSPKHNLRGNRSTNPSTATVRQEGADGEHFMKPKYFLPEENMAFLSTLSFYGPHRNQFSHSFDIICVL